MRSLSARRPAVQTQNGAEGGAGRLESRAQRGILLPPTRNGRAWSPTPSLEPNGLRLLRGRLRGGSRGRRMRRLRLWLFEGLDRRLLPLPDRRHPELEEHFAPRSEMGLDRGPELGGGILALPEQLPKILGLLLLLTSAGVGQGDPVLRAREQRLESRFVDIQVGKLRGDIRNVFEQRLPIRHEVGE